MTNQERDKKLRDILDLFWSATHNHISEKEYEDLVGISLSQINQLFSEGKENHCKDCCCAESWKALGIEKFTGLSIPEHIKELKNEIFELKGGFK